MFLLALVRFGLQLNQILINQVLVLSLTVTGKLNCCKNNPLLWEILQTDPNCPRQADQN